MGSETYHEPYEVLSPGAREMHRAIWSLIEELEAIDWYAQRAEVTTDPELKAVLLHNREEEIEHAMMNLEWIRRKDALFNEAIRTYLLTTAPISRSAWPERYLVTLWSTASAPSSSGRWRSGVANVLSTTTSAPAS